MQISDAEQGDSLYHSGFIDRSGNVLLFFEFDDLTRKERLLSSLFQAVTPRTAGFNTVELTDLSEAGQFITIALMFRKNHSRLHRTG